MTKNTYIEGNYYGINNDILLIEKFKGISKNGKSYWRARVKCPCCGREDWELPLYDINRVKSGRCKECRSGNLIGKEFGRLTVISKNQERDQWGNITWKCKCNCENKNIVNVATNNLKGGLVKSCGCLKRELDQQLGKKDYEDLTGKKFGKLTVIRQLEERDKYKNIYWLCQCDCCNNGFTKVITRNLKDGSTQSCGCLKSKGEAKINKILYELNINNIRQYSFENCISPKTNYKLKFDFYLPDYNCCIEYDGEQHFKARKSGFFTEDKVKEIQYRDKIKNQYCEDNNIELIRIPYTDLKIINNNYILERLPKKCV